MKIIDFDQKFFEFARKWVAAHPGLTEKQIDESYNRMMMEWLGAKADWLGGDTPEHYFNRYSDPDELLDLMKAYSEAKVNLPEPLYRRIVDFGEACEKGLREILGDESNGISLRAEAMGMLRDMDSRAADDLLIALVTKAQDGDELSEMAAEILSGRDLDMARRLMDAYEAAVEYAKTLILDVCVHFPGDDRVYEALIWRLKNMPEQRALHASYLAKLGDVRALDVLQDMMKLFDLSYFDYIELRDAVEALGGEAEDDRSFYGDPDFEALRALNE